MVLVSVAAAHAARMASNAEALAPPCARAASSGPSHPGRCAPSRNHRAARAVPRNRRGRAVGSRRGGDLLHAGRRRRPRRLHRVFAPLLAGTPIAAPGTSARALVASRGRGPSRHVRPQSRPNWWRPRSRVKAPYPLDCAGVAVGWARPCRCGLDPCFAPTERPRCRVPFRGHDLRAALHPAPLGPGHRPGAPEVRGRVLYAGRGRPLPCRMGGPPPERPPS